MIDYKKTIEDLRNADNLTVDHRILALTDMAARAIEELLSFAHYVANKVTMSDEDWEDYHEAFTEVACRKLVKLGVISIEDDMYVYRQDELRQEVQE